MLLVPLLFPAETVSAVLLLLVLTAETVATDATAADAATILEAETTGTKTVAQN